MARLDPPSAQVLLAAIVDSSDDAIVSKNLDAIVTSWNLGAERMFGYTAEEMIGQPITRLIPPNRQNEEPAILEQLKRGERVDHFESIRVRKDGSLIEVSLTISPVRDADGNIIGASKIARDIGEQKRSARHLAEANAELEAALARLERANDELKRAAQLKTEFVSTLSHELRTPLTAIWGWINILKADSPPVGLEEALTVIERNLRVQTQLIDDLLDMSRIEAGKLSLDVQSLDLPSVLAMAVDAVSPTASAKQIRLIKTFSSLGGVVMGDRNRLQQIAWNLLSNAIKFTPKGGRIHISTSRVNSHVEIRVADNGEGISPDFLPLVFDRFRQADGSTTRKHGGLGLGLSIVKHLVELHGGDVRAYSEGPGKGATFCVSLPLVPATAGLPRAAETRNASADAEASEMDLAGIKVLVIDDDADSATIVCKILRMRNAEVASADSVEAGLGLVDSFSPDVILSDIGMPGQDGYEFVRRLRSGASRQTAAVALTALARAEDRTRALRAGFNMHVVKPVEADELVTVVKSLFERAARK